MLTGQIRTMVPVGILREYATVPLQTNKQLDKLFGVDWVNSAAVGNRTRNILKKRFGRFRRSWESNQEHFEKNPIFLTPPADGNRTENISTKTASSIGANPPEQTRLNGTGFAKFGRS
jgi:hypothetical protein